MTAVFSSKISGRLKSAPILCISAISLPALSTGIWALNLYMGARSVQRDFLRPCLKALYVACLKSPPSVCFRCALAATNVIFISVMGAPMITPGCFRSFKCDSISLCQFLSSTSSLTELHSTRPLPSGRGSIKKMYFGVVFQRLKMSYTQRRFSYGLLYNILPSPKETIRSKRFSIIFCKISSSSFPMTFTWISCSSSCHKMSRSGSSSFLAVLASA